MKFALCGLLGWVLATPAMAFDLPRNARMTAERVSDQDRYALPIAPFDGETVPVALVDGAVKRQAWQIVGQDLTPLQIVQPVRADLERAGYRIVLDCQAERCGGFDFRFQTEVLPAPNMYVSLRNYVFQSYIKGSVDAPDAAVSVLVSTTRDAVYLQLIEAQTSADFDTQTPTSAQVSGSVARPVARPGSTEPIGLAVSNGPTPITGSGFLDTGAMVLAGLDFETGATRLGAGPFAALAELAQFLDDNPNISIALVGHTDSVGSLDGNIRISRARAEAVRARLIEEHGVPGARVEAQGAGYLSPIASNLTEPGRAANRRVEAVILSPR